MPRGNGMGPMGMGAMSRRGTGYCAGTGMPGFANRIPGRGSGMGFGRGWRHMFNAPEMEKQTLKSRADALQSELDEIKKRLSALEASS